MLIFQERMNGKTVNPSCKPCSQNNQSINHGNPITAEISNPVSQILVTWTGQAALKRVSNILIFHGSIYLTWWVTLSAEALSTTSKNNVEGVSLRPIYGE